MSRRMFAVAVCVALMALLGSVKLDRSAIAQDCSMGYGSYGSYGCSGSFGEGVIQSSPVYSTGFGYAPLYQVYSTPVYSTPVPRAYRAYRPYGYYGLRYGGPRMVCGPGGCFFVD